MASWKGLIASGIKRCVEINLCKPTWAASQKGLLESDLNDLLGVAEQVSGRLGWERTEPCGGEWNKWLRNTAGALRASQPELIQAIRDLVAPIATLNYDNLLTEVTGRRPITWKNAERWLPVLQGNDEAILHLHGHWDQPSSVVLGIRSYDAVMGKELAQHLQRVLASLHSLVFIGCSGTVQDPNFSALIGWMRDQLRGAEHSHYLLLRESERPPIDASLLRQARIVTLRYGAVHADLLPFIRSLAPSSSSASPPSVSVEHKDIGRSIKLPASTIRQMNAFCQRIGNLVKYGLTDILAARPRPTNGSGPPARGTLVPEVIVSNKAIASPWTSIFISHVYRDPETELLLQTLIPSLTKELAPSHSSYGIICEREMIADKEWHNGLYPWLHQCAAAILLISKQALDPRTPSVSHETFFLTVNKNSSRPDLCIIPILLNGPERYLQGNAIFDSRDLQRFRAISYPEPTQLNTVEALARAIADRLRAELPACNTSRPLPGLAAALAKKLAGFPETALEAAAMSLDPTASWSNEREALTRQLAEKLLKVEENDLLQAFSELCGWASGRRYYRLKGEVALALGAERLREEYAVPVAVEAALPAAANCRRPLLIRSTDDGILDLYITRAACQLPHRWQVFDVEPVLEFGQYADLKNSVRKIVAAKFGVDAGNKEADQLSRAMNAIPKLRKAGMPVLLRLGYPTGLDPASVFRLVREICPELMVMYTNPSGKAIEINSEGIYCLLGFDDYDDLTGVLGALFRIRETAEEEL